MYLALYQQIFCLSHNIVQLFSEAHFKLGVEKSGGTFLKFITSVSFYNKKEKNIIC